MNKKEFFQRAEYTRRRSERGSMLFFGLGCLGIIGGMILGGAIEHFFLDHPFRGNKPPPIGMGFGGFIGLAIGLAWAYWFFHNQKPILVPCPSCQKDLSNPTLSGIVKMSGCCPLCGANVLNDEKPNEEVPLMELANFCVRAELATRLQLKNTRLQLAVFFASWISSTGIAFALSHFTPFPFRHDALPVILICSGFVVAFICVVLTHYLIVKKNPRPSVLCPSCHMDLVFPKQMLPTRGVVITSKRCSCCGTKVIAD